VSCCSKLSPFQALGGGDTAPAILKPVCLFTVHMGSGSSLLFCGVFLPVTFISFPAPECWACAAAPASRRVCSQLTWEVGLPPSSVEFSSLRHSHKHSRFWWLGACPRFRQSLSSQAQLVYLQFLEGFPSPPLQSSGRPHPLCHVFIVLIAYSQFLFFPRVEVSLSRGLC
jgi:hypothetical protein